MTGPEPGHEPGAGFTGAAEIELDGRRIPVQVTLRGDFQPIDGRFHWYGRVTSTPALAQVRAGAPMVLHTAAGSAAGKLDDLDLWGRFRVAGTGTPPF